jgi:hypothetical protein
VVMAAREETGKHLGRCAVRHQVVTPSSPGSH